MMDKPAMRLFLSYVLLGMPALGVASYFRLKSGRPLPPKLRRYYAVIALQLLLLALSVVVANENAIELFGPEWPSLWSWAIAAAYVMLIAMSLRRGFRKLNEERRQRARVLLPEDPIQWRFWIVISILAGFSEECAYRGLAYTAVSQQTGSRALAVLICTAAFGIAHALQGWRGVLGTSVIALVFHGLVSLTRGLYMPIAVHIVYDLVVGYLAMRILMHSNASGESSRAGS
jgi:membrane protease YdiL (CAAX protease family)